MAAWTAPTGVTVAVGEEGARSEALAECLAAAWSVPLTITHTEPFIAHADGQTPAEALAAAIAAEIPKGDLLVIESTHADRWRSRYSVAEHLIDAHPSPTVALGPAGQTDLLDGPIVVALDGSDRALAALGLARALASTIGRSIVLARIVGEPDPDAKRAATLELESAASKDETGRTVAVVVESNDPITALVAICVDHHASFVALASSGDRTSVRSTMSRTTAGLIAEAPCPVVVAPSELDENV